jgi:spectinomycin phosphotransferase
MLEKPALSDEKIIASLRQSYGITASSLEFLPLGYDSSAWVYRATLENRQRYFLKVKRGVVYAPSITVPRYLKASGIEQVVAPLPTITDEFLGTVDQFSLLVYPYIDGQTDMEIGLSDQQWIEFGAVLKKIHSTRLAPEIAGQVHKETFNLNPKWLAMVRQLQTEILDREYETLHEKEAAAFWREKHQEIGRIADRAEELGRMLQQRSTDFVLCHSDIHTANLLLDPDGKLFVVDWDQPIFAPIERDLMFVVGDSLADFEIRTREVDLFFQGYGETEVDPLTLAYYRYEWVVQELGDFGERIFRMELGDETKADSVRGFKQLFDPGDVVEVAYKSAQRLSVS